MSIRTIIDSWKAKKTKNISTLFTDLLRRSIINHLTNSQMTSKDYRRERPLLQAPTISQTWKHPLSGTLSPETIVTSSSGYSTGGSSVSAVRNVSTPLPQQKTKGKGKSKTKHCSLSRQFQFVGFHHLINRLKSFIVPSKTKQIRTDQSFISYNHPPLTLGTSQSISLPFTYHQTTTTTKRTKNFDQIAAWLNDHEIQSDFSSRNVDDQGISGEKEGGGYSFSSYAMKSFRYIPMSGKGKKRKEKKTTHNWERVSRNESKRTGLLVKKNVNQNRQWKELYTGKERRKWNRSSLLCFIANIQSYTYRDRIRYLRFISNATNN